MAGGGAIAGGGTIAGGAGKARGVGGAGAAAAGDTRARILAATLRAGVKRVANILMKRKSRIDVVAS